MPLAKLGRNEDNIGLRIPIRIGIKQIMVIVYHIKIFVINLISSKSQKNMK